MRRIYQSPRFNDKNAIRSLLLYSFIFFKFSAVRMGVKKNCAYVGRYALDIFRKDFGCQQPSAKSLSVEHADQARVRARGRLDLVGDADLIYLFERKLHSS